MTGNEIYTFFRNAFTFFGKLNIAFWGIIICTVFSLESNAQCDFETNEIIVFNASGGNNNIDYETVYILSDDDDLIVTWSSSQSFAAQNEGFYKIYSLNYKLPANISLAPGINVYDLTADCFNLSAPFEISVCDPVYVPCYANDDEVIDFNISNVNANPNFTQVYVLTDENGSIVEISNTNSFSNQSIGNYGIYALDYETSDPISNLNVGENVDNLVGNCFDISLPFLIEICEGCSNFQVFLGDDFEICSGQMITLTANSSKPGTEYTWSTGETGSSITVSPAVTTEYTLTGVNGSCMDSEVQTITVLPLPSIDLGSDETICEGESVVLSASTSGGTVTWSTGETGNSISVSPSTTTTYTATVTNNGCTNTATIAVAVLPSPSIDLGSDETICAGESVVLSASTSGGTVTWSTGETGNSISVSPSATTTYTATVTNNGCTNTAAIAVAVLPTPSIDLGSDETVCEGESIVLSASTSGGTVSWSTGETGNSINVSPSTTTTYTATVTNNGCTNTATVTVAVLPTPSIDLGSDEAVCEGESVVLSASTSGGTVSWSTGETGNSISVSPSATTTYTATVTNNGCTNTATIAVAVLAPPSIDLGSDETICAGESVVLSASTSGGTVSWSTGETGNSINVSPSATTTYTATVTDNGCTNTAAIDVVVSPLPSIDLGSDETICQGESVVLTASTSGGTVSWSTGETGNSISVSPSTTTIYSATVNEGNCFNFDEIVVIVDNNCGSECTYFETDEIILNATGGNSALTSDYLITDESGNILLISSNTNIGSLTAGTYQAYAVNYDDNQNYQGIEINGNISNVSGDCLDISSPYEFMVCVVNDDCTYFDNEDIIINSSGANTDLTTIYLLTNNSGEILEIFGNEQIGSLTAGEYMLYAVNYDASSQADGITIGGNIANVSGECLDISTPYEFVVCASNDDCAYFDNEEIVINSSGANTDLTTVYLLTNDSGEILEIFSNEQIGTLAAGAYMLYAVNYDATLPVNGITVGGNIANVSGDCLDISDAYEFNVCSDTAIGDFVWFDSNYNGIQDSGEEGVEGVSVILLDGSGQPTGRTTITDSNGFYNFNNLDAGNYQVQFVLPDGSEFTLQNSSETGADDSNDSDVDENGFTQVVNLMEGEYNSTLDAGIFERLSLGNLVWNDTNNDGIADDNEDGVAFVDLALWIDLNDDNMPDVNTGRTAVTDADGNYLFTDLTPGDYIVQVIPSNFEPGGSLVGFNTSDGNGTPTDPDDNVNNDDDGIDAGIGIGIISNTISLISRDEPDNDGDIDINSNLSLDFGFFNDAILGDYVWNDSNGNGIQDNDEMGINGVVVNLYDASDPNNPIATTITSENPSDATDQGYYIFEGLVPGDYFVEFITPDGYLVTEPGKGNEENDSDLDDSNGLGTTEVITLGMGEENLTVDAGYYLPVKVGDYVWFDNMSTIQFLDVQDDSDSGLNGVTVNLYSEDDLITPFRTLVTQDDESGNPGYYLFTDLPIGMYVMEFELPNDLSFVVPNVGDDETDSDVVDFFMGRTLSFEVFPGDCIFDIDAGLKMPSLPVEWLYVKGEWNQDKDVNEVTWATGLELNNDYFEIERSFEGGKFEYIGTVEAVGNSAKESRYEFEDSDIAESGRYYYRLKQVDLDGGFEYSSIVVITINRKGVFSAEIYPNPTVDKVNIKVDVSELTEVTALLFDAAGKLVLSKTYANEVQAGISEFEIPFDNVAAGTYVIRLSAGDEVVNKKIIIIK